MNFAFFHNLYSQRLYDKKNMFTIVLNSLHKRRFISPNFITECSEIKNQCVFVKTYAPGGNKVQEAIFIFNVKVKVTRSLTLCHLKGHH